MTFINLTVGLQVSKTMAGCFLLEFTRFRSTFCSRTIPSRSGYSIDLPHRIQSPQIGADNASMSRCHQQLFLCRTISFIVWLLPVHKALCRDHERSLLGFRQRQTNPIWYRHESGTDDNLQNNGEFVLLRQQFYSTSGDWYLLDEQHHGSFQNFHRTPEPDNVDRQEGSEDLFRQRIQIRSKENKLWSLLGSGRTCG